MTRDRTAFALFGTTATEPAPRLLRAGGLTAEFANGNLRAIRFEGTEILRAIAFLVRDRDWGTCDLALSAVDINETENGFSLTYAGTCEGPGGSRLQVAAEIHGEPSGRLSFNAKASSSTGFETNRCGFCILHPVVGLAGEPARIEYVDGRIEDTRFPDLIEPWQPFREMRAITHRVMPGVTAECRMEGDTFEMEDQRNWSDASFKTYVRPLALPWPYRIEPDEPAEQRIRLSVRDERKAARPSLHPGSDDVVELATGSRRGAMPGIGLIVTPQQAAASRAAIRAGKAPRAQDLTLHFDPQAGHGPAAIEDFARLAAIHAGKTTLEIAVACERPLEAELTDLAAMMRDAGLKPDAVIVSPSVDRQSTPPGSTWPDCPPLEELYATARSAFPSLRLGGGMLSYFTELNRKRVPPGQLDFITHATNPIVHAADDASVMQTLEALPFITRSVRSIYADKPYRIGPSTIAMRQNPYGSRTMDNPAGRRLPMTHADPRHNGLFAAAFALGYAARVVDAGLDLLTLSALTGPLGLFAGASEPGAPGKPRALFHVVEALAGLAGSEWIECRSSDPASVLALAVRRAPRHRAWLIANITPVAQRIAFADETPENFEIFDDRLAFRQQAGRPLLLPPFAVAWSGLSAWSNLA